MSSQQMQPLRTAYFGKIPSRGDFVRNTAHPQLIDTLDAWLARTMDILAADPHWKALYDEARALHFAFLGSRSRIAVAGHLRPSHDHSGRRFPFLCAASLEVAQPLAFIGQSPLALGVLWRRMADGAAEAATAADPTQALQSLAALERPAPGSSAEGFGTFTELQTIAGIEQMLYRQGHEARVHDIVLALGILLRPVLSSASARVDKGLLLPLPEDPVYENLLAAFWLTLIAPFLARADMELACFIGTFEGRRRLALAFSGADPRSLAALLGGPQPLAERYIVLDEAAWVTQHTEADSALARLSSYLAQPQLSLRTALSTYREVFLGADHA